MGEGEEPGHPLQQRPLPRRARHREDVQAAVSAGVWKAALRLGGLSDAQAGGQKRAPRGVAVRTESAAFGGS